MFDFNRVRANFKGFRVVGDVHGEFDAFNRVVNEAQDGELFVVSLGDLTDRGPDSPGVMARALDLVESGQMAMVVGNHDDKLWRHLNGNGVKMGHGLDLTVQQLDNAAGEAVGARFHAAMPDFPLWATVETFTFVHGAFHPVMLEHKVVPWTDKKAFGGVASRAMFGQVQGFQDDGMPNRVHDWVDDVPEGHSVFVGHEVVPDQPLMKVGAQGGVAVFVDTGSGKGGPLSSVDVLF